MNQSIFASVRPVTSSSEELFFDNLVQVVSRDNHVAEMFIDEDLLEWTLETGGQWPSVETVEEADDFIQLFFEGLLEEELDFSIEEENLVFEEPTWLFTKEEERFFASNPQWGREEADLDFFFNDSFVVVGNRSLYTAKAGRVLWG